MVLSALLFAVGLAVVAIVALPFSSADNGTIKVPVSSRALQRCPAQLDPEAAVARSGHGVEGQVPLARARGLRLCRYFGVDSGQRSEHLSSIVRLEAPRRVASVVIEIDGLSPVPKGTYHCPNDSGEFILADFLIGGDEHAEATIRMSGCATLVLPDEAGAYLLTPKLHKRLLRLTSSGKG
jgi:hypothetical protein